MKWIIGVLGALVLAGLSALAADPKMDAYCLLQSAHDHLRHTHAGRRCIHYAATRSDTAAIDASVQAGVPVDAATADSATALALAAGHGRLAAVKYLLAHGARIGGSGDSETPLYRAAAHGHPAVVRALIAADANVDARNAHGRTALWINAARSPTENTEIAHSLVNAGATIDAADAAGDTPLMAAARAGNADLVGYFMAHGADAGHRNRAGGTALLAAIRHDHAESVRQLLARGADPAAPVRGVTPLEAARSRGSSNIVRLLQANLGRAWPAADQRPSK